LDASIENITGLGILNEIEVSDFINIVGIRVLTQGFALTKHVLYCLSHTSSPKKK
jgi:hypothetical protein